MPTNEAEVPPQRIWIQNDFSFFELNGNGTYYRTPDENSIPYVPASALDGVWEKAIAVAEKMAKLHEQHIGNTSFGQLQKVRQEEDLAVVVALEAARDAALSVGKGATSEEAGCVVDTVTHRRDCGTPDCFICYGGR